MRATLRFAICLVLGCSIGFAAIPRQAPVPKADKTSCCARMKAASVTHDCERHAPKPDQDQDCCAFCAFGLAVLTGDATSFVCPPVGDETFAAYISSEHNRSQRPPVPPPRA